MAKFIKFFYTYAKVELFYQQAFYTAKLNSSTNKLWQFPCYFGGTAQQANLPQLDTETILSLL
jgi:hypothetical protein